MHQLIHALDALIQDINTMTGHFINTFARRVMLNFTSLPVNQERLARRQSRLRTIC
jgi:hypothetical protein